MSGFFAWLRSRFPRRGEAFLAFMVCLLPVHIWSIIAFLRTVPSYLLWVDLGRLMGIFAYMQVFAFMESLLFFLLVLLLAFLLPRSWFLDRFVAQATLLALVTTLWIVPVHYLSVQASADETSAGLGGPYGILWVVSFLVALAGLSILFRRVARFQTLLQGFAEKIVPLSVVYLLVDLAAALIVVSRYLASPLA